MGDSLCVPSFLIICGKKQEAKIKTEIFTGLLLLQNSCYPMLTFPNFLCKTICVMLCVHYNSISLIQKILASFHLWSFNVAYSANWYVLNCRENLRTLPLWMFLMQGSYVNPSAIVSKDMLPTAIDKGTIIQSHDGERIPHGVTLFPMVCFLLHWGYCIWCIRLMHQKTEYESMFRQKNISGELGLPLRCNL